MPGAVSHAFLNTVGEMASNTPTPPDTTITVQSEDSGLGESDGTPQTATVPERKRFLPEFFHSEKSFFKSASYEEAATAFDKEDQQCIVLRGKIHLVITHSIKAEWFWPSKQNNACNWVNCNRN